MNLQCASVILLTLLFLTHSQAVGLDPHYLKKVIQELSQANFPWDDQLAKNCKLSLPALKVASAEILQADPKVNDYISNFKSFLKQEDFLESLHFYLKMFQNGSLFFKQVSPPLNLPKGMSMSIDEAVMKRFDDIFKEDFINKVSVLGIEKDFVRYAEIYSCSDTIVTNLTQIDPFGLLTHLIQISPQKNNYENLESFIECFSPSTLSKLSQNIIIWYIEILEKLSPEYQPYCKSGNIVTSLLLWRIIQFVHSCSKFRIQKQNPELQALIQDFIEKNKTVSNDIHVKIFQFLISDGVKKILIKQLNSLTFQEFIVLSNLSNRIPSEPYVKEFIDYVAAIFSILSCLAIGTGWIIYLKFYPKKSPSS